MMGERTGRVRDGGRTMRIARRLERGLAAEAGVELPEPSAAQAPLVIDGELHDQIMRLLSIVHRVAAAHLADRKEIDRAATRHRPRLRRQHGADTEAAAGHAATRHDHSPIGGDNLSRLRTTGSMTIARLEQSL
ncbi:MAG: hypothetical protein K2Y23_06540 [Cyanobacteria bacterium]|nr:hypothetical protein [Cyanobacteriota bacterium]